jgi:hypothetical protein
MRAKDFVIGVLCGALMFGGISAAFAASGAKTISASYGDIKIYVNQNRIEPRDANGNAVEPFISDGTTYLPVRAVAEALGQEVSWDGDTKSVYIGTRPEKLFAPAAESSQNTTVGNIVRVPNNGDARFVPKAGDRILCDDGSIYEIRDMSMYEHSGFTASGKRFPDGLPEPTCDWSVYPDVKLPDVEILHWNNEAGDKMYILNLYEMRRVQYTLYNYIYPLAVEHYSTGQGQLELKTVAKYGYDPAIEKHMGQIQFMDIPHPEAQGFYPYDENEVVKQVKNIPIRRFCIEVWDCYHNGNYAFTEYKLQMKSIEVSK